MNYCFECGAKLKKKLIDGVERYFCKLSHCNYVNWDNPVPVVAAIIRYQDKILLAQNTSWPDGRYSFITGYLERCEQPEVAVIREVSEELGLDAKIDRFIGHFIFHDKNQILIVYAVTAQGEIKLNHELVSFKLFSEQDILGYMFSFPTFAQSIIKKYLPK